MAITASGSQIKKPEQKLLSSDIRTVCLTVLLCVFLWGSVLGMANRSELLVWGMLSSLPACWVFLPVRGKRRAGLGAAMLIALLAASLLIPQARRGLGALLNALFDASESRQRYLYRIFSGADPAALGLGIALFGSAFSVLLSLLASRSRALIGWLPITLLLLAAAYLGVTPPALWLLGAGAVSALLVMPRPSAGQTAAVTLLFVCIGILALVLSPGENARVSALDESLRDRLAISAISEAQPDEASDAPEDEPDENDKSAQNDPLLVRRDRTLDTKTVLLIIVIVLALLFLFVPAVARDRLQKRQDRLRAGMDSADNRTASCAAFRYAVSWMQAAGVDFENLPFAEARERIKKTVSPERAEAFGDVLPLWQEARFSDHPCSDEMRDTLFRFQAETSQEIWRSKNRRAQFRLRWKNALWL